MKKHLLIFSLVCISFSTFQCKPKVQEDASRPMIEKKEQSGPEFTSAYVLCTVKEAVALLQAFVQLVVWNMKKMKILRRIR